MYSLWTQRKREREAAIRQVLEARRATERQPRPVREMAARRIYGKTLSDMVEDRFMRVEDYRAQAALAPPPEPHHLVFEHKFRERRRSLELPGFRANGHFTTREYVPRACYRGGGKLKAAQTAYLLGLLQRPGGGIGGSSIDKYHRRYMSEGGGRQQLGRSISQLGDDDIGGGGGQEGSTMLLSPTSMNGDSQQQQPVAHSKSLDASTAAGGGSGGGGGGGMVAVAGSLGPTVVGGGNKGEEEGEEEEAKRFSTSTLVSAEFPPGSKPPPVDPLLPRRCTNANADIGTTRGRLSEPPYTGPLYLLRERHRDKEMGPFKLVVKGGSPSLSEMASSSVIISSSKKSTSKGEGEGGGGVHEESSTMTTWSAPVSCMSFSHADQPTKWKGSNFRRYVGRFDPLTHSVDSTPFPRSLQSSESYCVSLRSCVAKKDKIQPTRNKDLEIGDGDLHLVVPSGRYVAPATQGRRRALGCVPSKTKKKRREGWPGDDDDDNHGSGGEHSKRTFKSSLVYETPSYHFQPPAPACTVSPPSYMLP